MYVPDNYDAYCQYEAEQERIDRLRKRKQLEYEKEEFADERIKDCCKSETRYDNNQF